MAISVRLDKSFSYRGVPEKWSNRYHLSGGSPSGLTEWGAIVDALVAAEKAIYHSTCTVVYATGYTSDSTPSAFTRDYTISPATPVPGTLAVSGVPAPGDAAAWIRWWCGQTNSRGKKIWLRKYIHDVYLPTAGGDALVGNQKTAFTTFANLLIAGLSISGFSSRTLCDKDGHGAVAQNVVTYVTTRTLKRRSNSPL